MVDVVAGNPAGERAELIERAPDVPHDPAHVEARPSESASVEPAAAEPAEPPVWKDPRDAIAARFKAKRAGHDGQFQPDHVPPFIEHAQPVAGPGGDPQNQTGRPAPEPVSPPAPAGYTLKVRGKDQHVATRDDLIRLAEVEPHEVADFTDAQLTRLAQKHAAALSYIEEGKSYRDQSRVAAPAPAGQPAGQQQQPAPSSQPQAQSLESLRKEAIEKTQLGDPDEAAQAWSKYEDAQYTARRAQEDAQSSETSARHQVMSEVAAFGQRNQDIVGNPAANDLLLMAATREMGADLRALGLTEDQLQSALTSPKEMTEAYIYARRNGAAVRTNAQILDAAGSKVRQVLGMPAPAAPTQPQQPASAALSRLDEKRGLPAQPMRSGNPQPVTPPPMDITQKRKDTIAQMQRARTGNNVKEFLGA